MRIILLTLLFSLNVHALKLPAAWYSEDEQKADLTIPNELNDLLSTIFTLQKEALEKNSSRHKTFALSEYSSGFSITSTGLFGLSALSAQRGVELFWKKTETKAHELEQRSIELEFSENKMIENFQIAQLTDLILQGASILSVTDLKLNLQKYFKDLRHMFNEVSGNRWNNWRFDGVRTDLFIGADGSISKFANIGAKLRLRIEWKYTPKVESKKLTNMSDLISNLLVDIDQTLGQRIYESFDLEKIYIGVGYFSKLGLYGIASTDYALMGHARFVRSSPKEGDINIEPVSNDLKIINGTKNKSIIGLFNLTRKRWRRGLSKILNMSDTFLTAAAPKNGQWSIYKVKTHFQLSVTGWLGFSTTKTTAAVEMVFKRKEDQQFKIPFTKDHDEWRMSDIRMRMRVPVSVKIPYLLEVAVYPEMEMFWTKI